MLAKQLSFLANADSAGLVLGARVPVILTSRADSVRSRIASCAVGGAGGPRAPAGASGRLTRAMARWTTTRLVLNAGSSSLKFCVYRRPRARRLAARGARPDRGHRHVAAAVGARTAPAQTLVDEKLDAAVRDGARRARRARRAGCARTTAARACSASATASSTAAPRSRGPRVVTPEVLDELRALDAARAAAPAAQPRARSRRSSSACPDVPQVACFDTGFHRGQRAVAELVPLPREIRDAGVQRYGFHGLSYEYIASVLPEVAPEIADGRVIVAHLGSGASLCALQDGKSVDSTLGFTALDGLCMGTRPGALDPGVVLYLFQDLGLSAKEVETMLYKKSGLLGISGISNDMRDLLGSSEPDARLAVDYFVYRAAKEIGALAAVLGGVDALVFTAGIGENSAEIRTRICEASAWLGDRARRGGERRAAARGSRRRRASVSAWVIPTNEELMIARHTGRCWDLTEPRSPSALQQRTS